MFLDELHVPKTVCGKQTHCSHSAAVAGQHVEPHIASAPAGTWQERAAGGTVQGGQRELP